MLGVNEHMGFKLFSREIIFEEFQRTQRYLIVTDRRTDRQTDDLGYCRIIALCASIAR